jgi:hypothetical protein
MKFKEESSTSPVSVFLAVCMDLHLQKRYTKFNKVYKPEILAHPVIVKIFKSVIKENV